MVSVARTQILDSAFYHTKNTFYLLKRRLINTFAIFVKEFLEC